jgi:hypothetical protein
MFDVNLMADYGSNDDARLFHRRNICPSNSKQATAKFKLRASPEQAQRTGALLFTQQKAATARGRAGAVTASPSNETTDIPMWPRPKTYSEAKKAAAGGISGGLSALRHTARPEGYSDRDPITVKKFLTRPA